VPDGQMQGSKTQAYSGNMSSFDDAADERSPQAVPYFITKMEH